MAGSRGVQNGRGNITVYHVQDLSHKVTGIECNSLTGLQEDFQSVLILKVTDTFFKSGDVVVIAGDMVAAAEVEPAHPGQHVPKVLGHGL